MADTDTVDRAKSSKVQVANLPPADSGRGLARLPARLMKALGLKDGDVIEIAGKAVSAELSAEVETAGRKLAAGEIVIPAQ